MGREEGSTLFMTTLMAFQILLSRYTGRDDIVVGTPVAGRGRAEFEGLIGFFVNMVLLRVSLRGDPSIRELLRRVREACLDAYANQDVPFEKLVEELRPERSLSQKPLFQVVFAHHKDLVAAPEIPGVHYEPVRVDPATSKFDLSLYTWKGRRDRGLTVSIEYNTDLFDAGTILRVAQQFLGLLRGIAAAPDKRLSELSLLREEERRQILFEWNEGRADYPTGCLHHALERQVERTPDSVAVVFEGEHLSYGELNRRANRLAHDLRALGVGPEVRVGLYLERSLDLVVGMLGILKSGGATCLWIPTIQRKVRFMLKDSRARVVVTHSALAGHLATAEVEQVRLDEPWPALDVDSELNPLPTATAANLAYVMYTSGSTGRPKGVAVTHANVFRLFQAAAERFDFGAADTWSLFHRTASTFRSGSSGAPCSTGGVSSWSPNG
jgi:non-ribosomal peptide synthetase component F